MVYRKHRERMTDMANVFCKLYLLANFTTESIKVMNTFENIISEDNESKYAFSTKECGAARLIRTVCKAFEERGSDECGGASYCVANFR